MAAGWRQILVRPLSDPDGPGASVEAPDAVPARWSRDGRSLLYVQRGEILSVPVTPGIKDVRLGKPSVVVRRTDVAFAGLEPSPDGERFFVVKRPPEEARRLVYVENWLNEIQEASRRAR
jgi:hypothetical protein